MNILYHITPLKNLTSILETGLIAKKSKGLTVNLIDKINFIWLTDNVEYILKNQAGKTWIEKHSPVVLEVIVTDLKIYPRIIHVSKDGPQIVPHEFYAEYMIDSNKIKVLTLDQLI